MASGADSGAGAIGRAFRKLGVDRNVMSKRLAKEVIVGLDIGTAKVLAVVAEVKENDEVEILGVGQQPSRGLRKGVVANIDSTVQSIQQAIEEAELTAECRISSVYAGIAGAHINSMNSHGVAAVKNRDEVSPEDVERVLDAAQAQAIPNDQQVLHILPQDFTPPLVDDGTLFFHHVIVFKDVFTNVKVITLDLFLGVADGLGDENVLDRFTLLDVHPCHQPGNPFTTENPE